MNIQLKDNTKPLLLLEACVGTRSGYEHHSRLILRSLMAMDKFEKNHKNSLSKLVRCQNAEEAVRGADIITTCTACRAQVDVLKNDWIKEGVHINALGGDTVGKTELEFGILSRGKIVVEYLEQCAIEGEIQRFSKVEVKEKVYAELQTGVCYCPNN